MQGDLIIDTRILREQADIFMAESRLADRLSGQIRHAERLSYGAGNAYQELLSETGKMSSFYARLSSATKTICEDAEKASSDIREDLEENIYGK